MIKMFKSGQPVDTKKNKIFKKLRYQREQIDLNELQRFYNAIQKYLDTITKSLDSPEEWIKNAFKDFLSSSLYTDFDSSLFNVGSSESPIDLVLWDAKYEQTIGVLFEFKSYKNRTEFPTQNQLNCKAMQEALLYFCRERLSGRNVYHICITNGVEIFLFDAQEFEELFQLGKQNITQFVKGQMLFNRTTDFYTDIAKGLIDQKQKGRNFDYFYINLLDFKTKNLQKKRDKEDIQNLYKLLHRRYLLKDFVRTSGTGINKGFYKELLYLLGIRETDKGILVQDDNLQHSIISQILLLFSRQDIEFDRPFSKAIELSMTWVNRLLFLKLLEDQLLAVDPDMIKFLDVTHLKNFGDIEALFFDIFNTPTDVRKPNHKLSIYNTLPYLNSSLFTKSPLENQVGSVIVIQNEKIPLYSHSILFEYLDENTQKELPILEYLLTFLNSYQFGTLNSSHTEKELIDHNILGNVFELLNGFEDGSVYTPHHLCEYLVEQAIDQNLVAKINRAFNRKITSLDDLNLNELSDDTGLTRKEIKKRLEAMINGLTIIDPAVGTGHFLTSVVAYILHLKSKLGIYDENEKLPNHRIVLEDHDIAIRHRDTNQKYVYSKSISSHVQKFIFEEKKLIIERILHGVDINPLSVDICKLRLWIELLKHAYFENEIFVTLPNLETKIKQGNSLIHRLQWYRKHHELYPQIKQSISKINDLNAQLFSCLDKRTANTIRQEIQKGRDRLLDREEIKLPISNGIYWQIDFPNLIDENGVIGFDIVIGNPPYIQLSKLKELVLLLKKDKNSALNIEYETFDGNGDIYALFYELGYELLKDAGNLAFITSNKFMRAGYGAELRRFLSTKTQITHLLDLGSSMFENATVDTCIVCFVKDKPNKDVPTKACDLSSEKVKNLSSHPTQWLNWYPIPDDEKNLFASENSWIILDKVGETVRRKVEEHGIRLKEIKDVKINRGIVTGLDEAFIINEETKNKILEACLDDDERERTSKVLKKIIRGKDIKRYQSIWVDLWVIYIPSGYSNSLDIDLSKDILPQMKSQYGSLFNHFEPYLEQLKKRTDKGEYWWELRACAYRQEFEKTKIVWKNISNIGAFYLDSNQFYVNAPSNLLIGNPSQIKALLAYMNSKMFFFLFKQIGITLSQAYEWKKSYVEQVSIPTNLFDKTDILDQLVDQVHANKLVGLPTEMIEKEIDTIVYKLLNLSVDEIEYIEKQTKIL